MDNGRQAGTDRGAIRGGQGSALEAGLAPMIRAGSPGSSVASLELAAPLARAASPVADHADRIAAELRNRSTYPDGLDVRGVQHSAADCKQMAETLREAAEELYNLARRGDHGLCIAGRGPRVCTPFRQERLADAADRLALRLEQQARQILAAAV